MGMTDKQRGDRLDDPLGQVSDLPAIEEERTPLRADAQKKERVVQETAEYGWLKVTEGEMP
jgi:hypothetical protein